MRKNVMTFKWFGKKYCVRRGGNLHLALEFGGAVLAFGAFGAWALFMMLLCA